MKISNFDIQRILSAAGYYNGDLDGDLGPKSSKGIEAILKNNFEDKANRLLPAGYGRWGTQRKGVAAFQLVLHHAGFYEGAIDGFSGMLTEYAYTQWDYTRAHGVKPSNDWRPDEKVEQSPQLETLDNRWPQQREVSKFYGVAGGPQCTSGEVVLPFSMRIAWNTAQTISEFRCHERVADPATRVYKRIASAYSPADIHRLGFDLFGGCYNNRNKRGGTTKSMHAYGIAIDHDPERNQLKWGRDRANLAKPECEEFFRCWEAEGWVSLGRQSNFDWMHVQAARL